MLEIEEAGGCDLQFPPLRRCSHVEPEQRGFRCPVAGPFSQDDLPELLLAPVEG
jgi:hypothetical protein